MRFIILAKQVQATSGFSGKESYGSDSWTSFDQARFVGEEHCEDVHRSVMPEVTRECPRR